MSQPELLSKVLHFLEENCIEYMITGSVVSSLQGEPRATHDIDIVVNITKAAIPLLVQTFRSPLFYLSEEAIKDAVERKSMFNLLDTSGGDKVDFWLLTDEPFDQERFGRKYKEDLPGMTMFVSSPEDTILMKLRWAKMSGGSVKQFTDALRVYELQYGILDLAYMNEWAAQLFIVSEWEKIQNDAKPIH